jgi:Flp pilus assembly pilin Flp
VTTFSFSDGLHVSHTLVRMFREEAGQDLIEYALLGALISVACVLVVTALGTAITGSYETLTAAFAAS